MAKTKYLILKGVEREEGDFERRDDLAVAYEPQGYIEASSASGALRAYFVQERDLTVGDSFWAVVPSGNFAILKATTQTMTKRTIESVDWP